MSPSRRKQLREKLVSRLKLAQCEVVTQGAACAFLSYLHDLKEIASTTDLDDLKAASKGTDFEDLTWEYFCNGKF